MTCQCEWHVNWYNPFKEHIKNVPEESKQFFEDMFDAFCETEAELEIDQAIIDGQWPSADKVIEIRRKKKNDRL
jgi:hypothetical protein